MDDRYENELNDFFNNTNKGKESNISSNEKHEDVENECTKRREIDEANKNMLTRSMHEWSNTIEYLITGERKNTKKIDVVRKGDNLNRFEKLKRTVVGDDDICGEITRALHPDYCLPREKEENNYEDELSRLQNAKVMRARHEEIMAKNRMSNKIKAKNYHRHMRKRDIKEFLRKESDNQNKDGLKERLDLMRVEERMSLKHKTGGKFAKLNKLRAKYDDKTREALEDMRNKGQELTRKIDDGSSDDEDEEVESVGGSEEESEDDDSNMEEMMPNDPTMAVTTRNNISNLIKEGEYTKKETSKAMPNVANVISVDRPMLFDHDENIMDDSNEVLLSDDRELFKESIYQVYQQDTELAAEFEREKEELVAKEAPQDVSTYVAGWGNWTGPGYEKKDKRKKKQGMVAAPKEVRVDTKKPRVWIRQGVHDGLKKHLIKSIPYPYNTVEQFELSRQDLVSSAFNMETVHRRLTDPRYTKKAGAPIYPLRKQEKQRHL